MGARLPAAAALLSPLLPCTVDVAGGKGELAFELLNLSGTPATVLEPRPLDLRKRIKWLQEILSRRPTLHMGRMPVPVPTSPRRLL